jgi:hypothetical protein
MQRQCRCSRAGDLGSSKVALAEIRLEINRRAAISAQQLRRHASLLFGEHGLRRRALGQLAPLDGARPWFRGLEEEEPLLPPLDASREPGEERAGGVLAAETVPPLQLERAHREEVPEHGDRGRPHAGEEADHDEPGHGAPPVGRELARRDAEVGEHLAEDVSVIQSRRCGRLAILIFPRKQASCEPGPVQCRATHTSPAHALGDFGGTA